MSRYILWMCWILSPFSSLGQRENPEIYLNHIYVVLDSATYQHLFDSSVLTKEIAYSIQNSTQTNQNSYTGKYIAGKNGYLEFFTPTSHSGLSIGSIGLGFMTLKSNDIKKVKQYWENNTQDSISFQTVEAYESAKTRPWYYDLELYRIDSNAAMKAWLMENTNEDLRLAGFSEQEIEKDKISWQSYIERQNKTTLKKAFNRILSIQLSIDKSEFKYLRKTLLGFGLIQSKHAFYNDNIIVKYKISSNSSIRLKKLEMELSETFAKTVLTIGDSITVQLNGKRAIWNFK